MMDLSKFKQKSERKILPKWRMPVVTQLIILAFVVVFVLSVAILPQLKSPQQATPADPQTDQGKTDETKNESEEENSELNFNTANIMAESALVYDVKNDEVLYQKSPNQVRPLASITKLMTMLLASELIAEDSKIKIPEMALKQYGDSGLSTGESFVFESIADYTLMSSVNDGAFAIANVAGALLASKEPTKNFVKAMNVKAEELGMTETYFRNPTGLDINQEEAGAEGTATDVAKLMQYILENKPDILNATTKLNERFYNENGQYHNAQNTNYTVSEIPGLIGSKTGYTKLSGGNLAIAFKAGLDRPIIIVVLGSTYSERFEDVKKLTEATLNEID